MVALAVLAVLGRVEMNQVLVEVVVELLTVMAALVHSIKLV